MVFCVAELLLYVYKGILSEKKKTVNFGIRKIVGENKPVTMFMH